MSPVLRAAVEERLAALDPLEHRRIDLGRPWPCVVIGPTGVAVVAPAPAGPGRGARQLAEVRGEVERTLRGTEGAVTVRGLLVVESAGRAAVPSSVVDVTDRSVARVTPHDLRAELARGPLVPMATIAAAHARLVGNLAHDRTGGGTPPG